MLPAWSRLAVVTVLASTLAGCAVGAAARCRGTQCRDSGGQNDSSKADDDPPGTQDGGRVDAIRPGVDAAGVLTLRVEPAMPVVRVVDGQHTPITFRAVGVRDGRDVALAGVVFHLDKESFGTVNRTTGEFRASGNVGGTVLLYAIFTSGSTRTIGTVSIEVFVERNAFLNVGAESASSFQMPPRYDPARAAQIVYPLEGAVMPRNVHTPHIQWTPVEGTGDLYRVRVVKPHAAVTGYMRNTGEAFEHAWKMEGPAWETLAASDRDDDIVIAVDRVDSTSNVIVGDARRIRLARGSLYGRVYYWQLGIYGSEGSETMQIDPVTAARTLAVPNLYRDDTRADVHGRQCIGCHTVSRDGRYLWGNNVLQLSYDLTGPLASSTPSPSRFPPVVSPIALAGFDPTGSILVGSTGYIGGMQFLDATNGAALNPQPANIPTSGISFPEWSPDGRTIAYACNVREDEVHPGNRWPRYGDLCVLERTGTSPLTFAPERTILTGTALSIESERGSTNSHPVWTPDSAQIIFQHGIKTFTIGEATMPPAAIYAIDRNGGTPSRLTAASGANDAYWPTTTPYITNERNDEKYYWIAFYARRPYGNAKVGSLAHNVRQLWVAGVRTTGSGDRSFTAYWLPGQEPSRHSLAAYWGPDACRSSGTECGTGSECCSGACGLQGGAMRCMAPSDGMCRAPGQLCGASSECCSSQCMANRCAGDVEEPPCPVPPCQLGSE